MNILAEPFWVHKRGNAPEEYEDAAWPVQNQHYQNTCVRLAVADGATESVFARRWAEQLVSAVGNGKLSPHSFAEGVTRLRAIWHEWLAGKCLPWYAEEKARQGAFAALVVLELSTEEPDGATDGSWQAAAVGDSCLFHVRGENVLARFPLAAAEAFDNRPFLLSSVGAEEKCLGDMNSAGTWRRGDTFYLMTDALACWFLKYIDAGGSPTDVHSAFATNEVDGFSTWVNSLRDNGSIRNDDCTLVRVFIR